MAGSSYLTNNFKANMILALPTVYLMSILYPGYNYQFYLIFLVIYTVSSRFYNPDLDHRTNRPGMLHFPLGKTIMEWLMKLSNQGGVLRILEPIIQVQKIITKTWYILWFPLVILVTHRGIIHWPIIGVNLRNFYLYAILYLLDMVLSMTGIHLLSPLKQTFLEIFQLFLNPNNTPLFIFFILPIYIADINHSLVDAADSIRNKRSFCPAGDNAIPKGLIYTFLKVKI